MRNFCECFILRAPEQAQTKETGPSPVSRLHGRTLCQFKPPRTTLTPGPKTQPEKVRPHAKPSPPGLGDRDAAACGEGRSRSLSSPRHNLPPWQLVANGALLDLRELNSASVLRSSFEPRLCNSRKKPRFQCKASSRPHPRGAGSFAEGTADAEEWACRPRCLVPGQGPTVARHIRRHCHRIRYKQRYRAGRLNGVDFISEATSSPDNCIVIPMVGAHA